MRKLTGKNVRSAYRKKAKGRKQPPPSLKRAPPISPEIALHATRDLPVDQPLFQRAMAGNVALADILPYNTPPPYQPHQFSLTPCFNTVEELEFIVMGLLAAEELATEREAKRLLRKNGRLQQQEEWTQEAIRLANQWEELADMVFNLEDDADEYLQAMACLHCRWVARRFCHLRGLEFLNATARFADLHLW
ncbi:hypothetical protein C8F01DRAFT_1180391 [Mycena amicta]|nr:hypothetical protein C8F01DRAFT_1180391 [Mycena amicta]